MVTMRSGPSAPTLNSTNEVWDEDFRQGSVATQPCFSCREFLVFVMSRFGAGSCTRDDSRGEERVRQKVPGRKTWGKRKFRARIGKFVCGMPAPARPEDTREIRKPKGLEVACGSLIEELCALWICTL